MRYITFVPLLIVAIVPPAFGQEDGRFSVELENGAVIQFARRASHGDDVYGRPKRYQRTPIENRLDWLIYVTQGARSQVLVSGPIDEDPIERSNRFYLLRRKLEKSSKEIAAKRDPSSTADERSALEKELKDIITTLFPARGIKSMNQAEILVRGPLHYFGRNDVRELFGITDQQFESMLETTDRVLKKYQRIYESERLNVFKNLFQHVSESQVKVFESIVGIRLADVPAIYRSLDHRSLIHAIRLSPHQDSPGSRPKKLAAYNEDYIGILFSGLSDAKLSTRMRDEFPLVNQNGSLVVELRPIRANFESGLYASSALQALPMIRKSINASDQPLSEEQEELYKVMMHGDGVVDGLTGPIAGGIYALKNSRLKRKMQPFAESLTQQQQVRARDTLLFVYGPLRLMLNPPIFDKLDIDDDQRLQVIEDSFESWDNLRLHLDKPQKEVFLAILQQLNDRQQAMLRDRIGVEFETLADRYSIIEHYAFLEDFSTDYEK